MKQLLKDIFIKNWKYKLLAFAAAIGMWYYVVRDQTISIVVNVPVELANYPEQLKLKTDFKSDVALNLNGRRDVVTAVRKKDLKIIVNLKDARAGRNVYTIVPRMIEGLPVGVAINDISPSRLILNFDANEKKESPAAEITPAPAQKGKP